MTIIGDRWKRIPIVYRTATVASVALVVIGALVITLIVALAVRSKLQADVQCVNNVLGARNQPTIDETNAQVAHAEADGAYIAAGVQEITALVNVIVAPKATQLQEYRLFIVVAQRYQAASDAAKQASDAYIAALAHVLHDRQSHPLGHC